MLIIPEQFKMKLNADSVDSVISDIHKLIFNYGAILDNNTMDFFPEYTDHGIKHINSLLLSCENIIPKASMEVLSSLDISVLIYSIILHDLGMHITVKQFEKLIESERIIIPGLDSISWKNLWANYLNEMKKIDNERKLDIFGTEYVEIKKPNFKNLDDFDRRLIGEFVRINHPRIAHEIAFDPLFFFHNDLNNMAGFNPDICDIAGFIARSHGMNLRNTFNYLQNKFGKGWKMPYNIQVVYLMAALRISDYIQIDNTRANNIILKTKRFLSDFSLNEWHLHNCIDFILEDNEDPEQIHVHSIPKNVFLFLKLKNLLKDIQKEVDLTWAVLGETYGSMAHFKSLGLKYRRITSNIDNLKSFSEKVDYVPSNIKFKTDPAVLKLLIKPLYNNDPSLGVRELLQNSVDACMELTKFKSDKNELYIPEIFIGINKNSDGVYLTIKDNGIGMNEDVIVNCYFEAGVSFRNSKEWLSLFSDEKKNAHVQRSGRFGIGALGAFLLGDNIEVETCRYLEKYSYKFKSHITSDNIEIKKSNKLIIGTSISIRLSDETLEKINSIIKQNSEDRLDWFMWYKYQEPKIIYDIDQEFIEAFKFLSDDQYLPSRIDNVSSWRSFKENDYTSIVWTYDFFEKKSPLYLQKTGALTSNGIVIKNGFKIKSHQYFWAMPSVEIVDNNGYLPLSLDRNSIYNNQLPIEKSLLVEICKDLIAAFLSLNFQHAGGLIHLHPKSTEINYKSKISLLPHIIFNKKGYLINNFTFFRELNIKEYLPIWLKENSLVEINLSNFDDFFYNIYRFGEVDYKQDILSMHQNDIENARHWFSPINLTENSKNSGICKLLYRAEELNPYFVSNPKYEIDPILKARTKIMSSESTMISQEPLAGNILDAYNSIKNHSMIILSASFGSPKAFYECNVFNELLIKYLSPNFLLPFSLEERKNKYPLAFRELKDKIEWYISFFGR